MLECGSVQEEMCALRWRSRSGRFCSRWKALTVLAQTGAHAESSTGPPTAASGRQRGRRCTGRRGWGFGCTQHKQTHNRAACVGCCCRRRANSRCSASRTLSNIRRAQHSERTRTHDNHRVSHKCSSSCKFYRVQESSKFLLQLCQCTCKQRAQSRGRRVCYAAAVGTTHAGCAHRVLTSTKFLVTGNISGKHFLFICIFFKVLIYFINWPY